MRITRSKIITAVDIGTTKIVSLIGREHREGIIDVLGVGIVPSDGLNKGVVVDVNKTISSIKKAVHKAEQEAGLVVKKVIVGVSGSHIRSYSSRGIVPITCGFVTQQDIDDIIASARAIPMPDGYKLLHVLPRIYTIDGDQKVKNPLGMHGSRLEVDVHLVIGAVASINNLISCCQYAGLLVEDVVLEQLASAEATLSQDEKDVGVLMVDIGGGTSDVALYQDGAIRHTSVIPVGGTNFTADLSVGLRVTKESAELLKKMYSDHNDLTTIEATALHGLDITSVCNEDVAAIVEPRAEELFQFVMESMKEALVSHKPVGGIVLTGGGSLLYGIDDIAARVCGMSVRCGVPRLTNNNITQLGSPIYATGYGLLRFGLHKQKGTLNKAARLWSTVFDRMRSWVADGV